MPALRLTVLAILVVVIFLLLKTFLLDSDTFKVAKVQISGAKSFVNNSDLKEIVHNQVYRKNIFSFNTVDLAEILKRNFRGAKSFTISRQLPASISVEVTERTPLALIHNGTDPNYYLIDDQGYVLGSVDRNETNFPLIDYEGPIKIDEYINEDLVPTYLSLVSAIDKNKLNVNSMSFYPKYARLYLDGIQLLISNDKDKEKYLYIVYSLLKQLASENKKVTKIDLRYDKLIVEY